VGRRRGRPVLRLPPVADLRRVQRLPDPRLKIELAQFAADTGLHATVCHLSPGIIKWNKVEHQLFSQITLNWRGRPLRTHQVIVNLISSTTTTTGLTRQISTETGTTHWPHPTRRDQPALICRGP